MANDVQGVKSGNMGRVIIIMGSLIIVALVGVIVALVLNLNRGEPEVQEEERPSMRATVVTEDNVEEIVQQMIEEPPVEAGYFEVSMNMEWYFLDGTSPSSNAFVRNVPNNTNDVYFDVSFRDSGDVIYESPVIPLGAELRSEDVILNRDLGPGTYECVCTYHLIDENQNTVDTVNMGLTVIVVN